jgi:hypothetical protein
LAGETRKKSKKEGPDTRNQGAGDSRKWINASKCGDSGKTFIPGHEALLAGPLRTIIATTALDVFSPNILISKVEDLKPSCRCLEGKGCT